MSISFCLKGLLFYLVVWCIWKKGFFWRFRPFYENIWEFVPWSKFAVITSKPFLCGMCYSIIQDRFRFRLCEKAQKSLKLDSNHFCYCDYMWELKLQIKTSYLYTFPRLTPKIRYGFLLEKFGCKNFIFRMLHYGTPFNFPVFSEPVPRKTTYKNTFQIQGYAYFSLKKQ